MLGKHAPIVLLAGIDPHFSVQAVSRGYCAGMIPIAQLLGGVITKSADGALQGLQKYVYRSLHLPNQIRSKRIPRRTWEASVSLLG